MVRRATALRHCGTPDVARCGFRYNARGISKRYRCNECQRKLSVPHVASLNGKPSELIWLLNEMEMVMETLVILLGEPPSKLETVARTEKTENHITR
jgi:transposase-like protein